MYISKRAFIHMLYSLTVCIWPETHEACSLVPNRTHVPSTDRLQATGAGERKAGL